MRRALLLFVFVTLGLAGAAASGVKPHAGPVKCNPGHPENCPPPTTTTTTTGTTTTTPPPSGYPASFFTGPLGAANPLPPLGRRFLIEWYGGDGLTLDQQRQGVLQREADVGRPFDGVGIHYGGGGTFGGAASCSWLNPADLQEQWVHDHGSLPVVSWSPNATLGQINNGERDACYRAVADYFRQFPFPIMLRMMWEFNGNWFGWSVPPNYTGADFVAAWRRIVGIFQAEGASNVGFWWCPSEGQDRAIRDASYPGDAYVDWAGPDGYNHFLDGWSTPLHAGWAEFREIFDYTNLGSSSVSTYSQYAARKPFVIGETGTKYDPADATRKGNWYRNVASADMPNLIGVQFFDQDLSVSEGNNWRVDYPSSQPDAYQGFRDMAAAPAFAG